MTTDIFLQEVQDNLERNILPFWLAMKDPRGGFYGEADAGGKIDYGADRGVILNARIIWAFSAAYGKFPGRTEYLVAAAHAKDYFVQHFVDHKWGGVYWSVDSEGERKDVKKQLYSQGFAIYALSEFYRVSRDDDALKQAVNLFRIVEKEFRDGVNGGYIEALDRDFSLLEDMSLSSHDINADKTMNSHLHLLEAYANLYTVWPDALLKERVAELLDILTGKIMAPSGHLQLYFDRSWNPLPGGISYGHDIETAWLSLECAFALRDADAVNRIRPAAALMARAGDEGLLPDGSMIYERLPGGALDESRQWWVQAESVVGNLWAWKYLGISDGAERAMASWAYIRDNLVDSAAGEWYWAILPDGAPDMVSPKAGFWKCPYHNTRMCLQVLSVF